MMQFIRAGYYTSVQDRGRYGWRYYGVPVSGPVDRRAFALANALLPVEDDSSVLECHFLGPKIRFCVPLAFVITGALVKAHLNGKLLHRHEIYSAQAGDVLDVGKVQKGLRVYLKFSAKLNAPRPMGSSAMFVPITPKARFADGDTIQGEPIFAQKQANAHIKVNDDYLHEHGLVVSPGPDFAALHATAQAKLLKTPFTVRAQSRMGYRLSGSFHAKASAHLASQLVVPGLVQLTPSGELLVAMADAQVTGGYMQVLQLSPVAQNILSQKREGDSIKFRCTPS